MGGGDPKIGGPMGTPYLPGQETSIENTFLDKLHAPPPNDSFKLTKDFFNDLSASDAKSLFDQLQVFNDLSAQFNGEFDGPSRAQLMEILQSKFDPASQPSPEVPPTFDSKAGGGVKQELGIFGTVRGAQIHALLDDTFGGVKEFKTRDEALASAGGVNSKDTSVLQDQTGQWHAIHPDKEKWIQGRKEIHSILDDINNRKIDPQEGRMKLDEAYRNTLAAALGVPPDKINVLKPGDAPKPNMVNFDPTLKGKEGTAGAAKLDGNPKSIVLGPDAIAQDNPFDTIDVVSHEATHVRLADKGNDLLGEWQKLKNNKLSFPKWLESQYKSKNISAEELVVTSAAYKGGSAASEAASYINGLITAFAQDRSDYQKALGFSPSTRMIDSALAQAAKFTPESFDLSHDSNVALQKDLMAKLQDFYKHLDAAGQTRFDAALAKAKHDYPKSWLIGFNPKK